MRGRTIGAILLATFVIAAAPFIGGLSGGPADAFILLQLRIPRVLMAVLVGSTLSLVGAVYQTVFANALASETTVGTGAGATLGALVAIVFLGTIQSSTIPFITICAFVGALAVTIVLTTFASNGRARLNDLLLLGIGISLAAAAISGGIQYSADSVSLAAAVQWSFGHLPQIGYRGVIWLMPFAATVIALLLRQTRPLETMLGGEELAHSQGVDVPRLRAITLGTGALGVAACVAWCGPIAFVGLIVPHIVRRCLAGRLSVLLPMSAVAGALFLVICDTVARLLLPGRDLPVGVLTAAVGAPVLMWLVTGTTAPRD